MKNGLVKLHGKAGKDIKELVEPIFRLRLIEWPCLILWDVGSNKNRNV